MTSLFFTTTTEIGVMMMMRVMLLLPMEKKTMNSHARMLVSPPKVQSPSLIALATTRVVKARKIVMASHLPGGAQKQNTVL
jgi:hypothetical protein